MKKVTIAIILVFMSASFLYFLAKSPALSQMLLTEGNLKNRLSTRNSINLILTDKMPDFSLAAVDSDMWSNALLMEQVVGTLVKYGRNGSYEPFLAEKWISSSDEKEWSFTLRPNLKTENNKEITAAKFVESIKAMLKIYGSSAPPPVFSEIVGWSEFEKGAEEKLEIRASGDTIVFKFQKKPSGVLEFLSTPYFGYYDEIDLKGSSNGHKSSLISSGAYRVKNFAPKAVELEIRKDSIFYSTEAPARVRIIYKPLDEISPEDSPAIIQLKNGDKIKPELLKFSHEQKKTPTILSSLILSPYIEPFNNIEMRKSFRDIVRSILDRINDKNLSERKSFYFYPAFKNYELATRDLEQANIRLESLRKSPITLFRKSNGLILNESLLGKLTDELKKTYKINLNIIGPDEVGKDWLAIASKNRRFPIRFTSVDIGGAPESWLLEMMFRGTLGVSFPDPKRYMEKVVNKYENNEYKSTDDYWRDIHEIIESESTIIVLGHWGASWLITNDIPQSNFSQTMNVPRFDLVRLNDEM